MDAARVKEFWFWFEKQCDNIERLMVHEASEDLSEKLTRRVRTLSEGVGWEVGPGVEKRCSFTFTLNSDSKNVEIADAIVGHAPTLINWEFRVGRTRRPHNSVIFSNQFGQEIEIDLSQMRYVLTAFDNGAFFDIDVATTQQLHMDHVAQQQVIRTIVQFALGEKDALNFIDRVGLIDSPDSEWGEASTPFEYLAKHFDSLLGRSAT